MTGTFADVVGIFGIGMLFGIAAFSIFDAWRDWQRKQYDDD